MQSKCTSLNIGRALKCQALAAKLSKELPGGATDMKRVVDEIPSNPSSTQAPKY